MSTAAHIARMLFPVDKQVPRRRLARRGDSMLSQLASLCYALVPLGLMLNIYWDSY